MLELRSLAAAFDLHLLKDWDGWLDARERWFAPNVWSPSGENQILVATWDRWAQSGPSYGHSVGPGTIYVLPVPVSLKRTIHAACISSGMPALNAWLEDGKGRGDGWTMVSHRAIWSWPSGRVSVLK